MKDYSSYLPLKNEPAHHRQIKITTCRLDQNHIQIRAELQDQRGDSAPIHGMIIRLCVRRDMVITQAEFSSPKAPYVECSTYKVGPERLVGKSAGKGFTRFVYETYGSVNSCSHIVTLLVNLAPALRQGMAFAMFFPDEEKQLTKNTLIPTVQGMAKFLEDSCMVWAKNSPVQKDIAQGEVRNLPARIYPNFRK
ncbi:MAG: DUF2889 domain-containing protein [Deltaproteobacteria bacterium]|nr:DUF2889 domain-containing protein [Deltaproteobacteria bacterium]